MSRTVETGPEFSFNTNRRRSLIEKWLCSFVKRRSSPVPFETRGPQALIALDFLKQAIENVFSTNPGSNGARKKLIKAYIILLGKRNAFSVDRPWYAEADFSRASVGG